MRCWGDFLTPTPTLTLKPPITPKHAKPGKVILKHLDCCKSYRTQIPSSLPPQKCCSLGYPTSSCRKIGFLRPHEPPRASDLWHDKYHAASRANQLLAMHFRRCSITIFCSPSFSPLKATPKTATYYVYSRPWKRCGWSWRYGRMLRGPVPPLTCSALLDSGLTGASSQASSVL